jgi:hypothetical protein
MSRSHVKRATLYFACLSFTFCMLVLALVGTATGATLYVPGDSNTIQGAIDVAVDGDEIEVAPGTYLEAIDFGGKAVRLYSSGGPALTTIDASGLNLSVVTCKNGEGATTIIEGFTVTGGSATNGGGMLNDQGSNPTVNNCIFTANSAWRGGGMLNDQGSNPTVTNCIFTSNTGDYGGGMYNAYGSNSTVTNCIFENNNASWFGGGMDNKQSDPTVTNCIFIGNVGCYGGGMFIEDNSSPTVTNCTFTNNASFNGGGIYIVSGCSPTVANCILWADTSEIVVSDSTPTVTYSDVQGGWTGAGNIDADPIFADADGRLSFGSPCIDVGDNSAVPPYIATDIDGNPRIVNDTVDMGAYEYQIILVQIDIKPGSDPNSINLCSDGAVPIAILGSDTFSVSDIDTETLRFADAAVKVVGRKDPHALCSVEDVNGDMFDDLVCHYLTTDIAAIDGESTTATLNGELLDGTPIEGTDSVNIVKDICQ